MMILIAILFICIGLIFLVVYFRQARQVIPGEDAVSTGESPANIPLSVPDQKAPKTPRTPALPDSIRRIDPDSIRDAVQKITTSESMAALKSEQLITRGILFMDKTRRLPGMLGKFEELPVRFFDELRRVGSGNLIIEEGAFIIRSGNATYHYSIGDLDQIIFQPTGVALVPIMGDRSVALFITEDAQKIRDFIKEHVRMKSAV